MTHKEKYNDTATVDVIIPAYRPGREFGELLHRLEEQEYRPRNQKKGSRTFECRYYDLYDTGCSPC